MTDIPDVPVGSGALATIAEAVSPKSISYPDDRHLHLITDEDLDALKLVKNEPQTGIALASFGAMLPSIPGAVPALKAIWTQTPAPPEAVGWLTIFLICLVLVVVCGINGWRNKNRLDDLIEAIRNRETLPLTPRPQADVLKGEINGNSQEKGAVSHD